MKDFFRKNGKKLIAVLCSLTLVISCFQGIGSLMPDVKASDNTYTELTFSDFGIADQSFNSTTAGVAGKPSTDIKSLDKTIITGKITLSSHVDEHILSRRLCRKLGALSVAYTIKNQEAYEKVKDKFDLFIFDSFILR